MKHNTFRLFVCFFLQSIPYTYSWSSPAAFLVEIFWPLGSCCYEGSIRVLMSYGCRNRWPQTSWLKTIHIYYFVVLWVRSLAWVSLGYNQGGSRAASLPEVLGENPLSCLFHLLEVTHIPWSVPPLPSSKPSMNGWWSPSHVPSLWPLLPPPSSSFKDSCDNTGHIWLIQNHLFQDQLIGNLNYIFYLNFSWPCKVTHSQVPGIKAWTSLRAHYTCMALSLWKAS